MKPCDCIITSFFSAPQFIVPNTDSIPQWKKLFQNLPMSFHSTWKRQSWHCRNWHDCNVIHWHSNEKEADTHLQFQTRQWNAFQRPEKRMKNSSNVFSDNITQPRKNLGISVTLLHNGFSIQQLWLPFTESFWMTSTQASPYVMLTWVRTGKPAWLYINVMWGWLDGTRWIKTQRAEDKLYMVLSEAFSS